jgi:hypothetical protein
MTRTFMRGAWILATTATAAAMLFAMVPVSATANRPPTVSVDVEFLYCRGDFVEIAVRGADPDNDPLSYELTDESGPLPNDLRINRRSGLIRGVLGFDEGGGSSTPYDVEVAAVDPGGLSATVSFSIFSVACEEPRISRFVLVDARRDVDLRMLRDGDTLTQSRPIDIRVDAFPDALEDSFYGQVVDSVRLELDGRLVRVERQPPYALSGDRNGDYRRMMLPVGHHTLTATAYDGDGNAGESETISFEVRR